MKNTIKIGTFVLAVMMVSSVNFANATTYSQSNSATQLTTNTCSYTSYKEVFDFVNDYTFERVICIAKIVHDSDHVLTLKQALEIQLKKEINNGTNPLFKQTGVVDEGSFDLMLEALAKVAYTDMHMTFGSIKDREYEYYYLNLLHEKYTGKQHEKRDKFYSVIVDLINRRIRNDEHS